jgi:hypothetical protein
MATRVSWGLEEMIISLVMPATPLRFAARTRLARPQRRHGEGQSGRTHREDAAQEEGEDERHTRTVYQRLWEPG